MTTATAIDLGPEIDAICAKLGLEDKTYVAELVIQPTHVRATVLKSRDGSKFIDEETGEVAQDVLGFKVTT